MVLGFFVGESVYGGGCGGGNETLLPLRFFPKLALGGDVLGWRAAFRGERPLVRDNGWSKIISCDDPRGEFSSEKTSKKPCEDGDGILVRSAELEGLKKDFAGRVEAIDTRHKARFVLYKAVLKFSDPMTRPYVLWRAMYWCWPFCVRWLMEQSHLAEVDLGR